MTQGARFFLTFLSAGAALAFLVAVKSVALPFIIGLLLAYFLDPLVDALQTRLKFPRWLGALVVLAAFFLIAAGILMAVVPVVSYQAAIFRGRIPAYAMLLWSKVRDFASLFDQSQIASLLEKASARATGMLLGLVGSGLALLNVLGLLLITPIVGFYMLKDWDSFRKYFSGLVPKDRRPAVNAFMEIVDKSLSGFVRGQLMVCTALAFYYAVALMLAGLDIAVPIGIVTGYLIFIPYLGWTIGFLLAMGVAAAQFSDVAPIIVVMAVYLFGMGFEGWFLTPKLVGEKVGLHPVAVMFALLCGGVLGGLGGVVLAIPVASVISACLQLWVKSRKS